MAVVDESSTLEPQFVATLSKEALEVGELKHMNIETLRKISMSAGLTNSSQELEAICNLKPKEFQDALEFGLQSYEHYQNLLRLMESAILRIYSVGKSNPAWKDFKRGNDLEERVANILTSYSSENRH